MNNVYLFNSGINVLTSSMFSPLQTRRFEPLNIYELTDNVYYVECMYKMWVEDIYGDSTSRRETEKAHMIVRRNNSDDDWRMYKYGKGWLSRSEIKLFADKIKHNHN